MAISPGERHPGANPLKDAHAALDTAVLTASGFSAKKDLLAQLLALNQQVAAKIEHVTGILTRPAAAQNQDQEQDYDSERKAGLRNVVGLHPMAKDRRGS